MKIPDVAGGKGRTRHQDRCRNEAIQSFNTIAGAELPGKLGMRESTSITVSIVSSASFLAASEGVRCG